MGQVWVESNVEQFAVNKYWLRIYKRRDILEYIIKMCRPMGMIVLYFLFFCISVSCEF